MSQPSSSIMSGENPEIKYKKALKEISKLIHANRALRESSDNTARTLKQKIDELSLRYEDLEKEYDTLRKEKDSLSHYLDQLQKEKNNVDRELAYLNDVLQSQNAELKKLNLHKDESAVATLIRTYEEKEAAMLRNRNQNEDMIAKLKAAMERLENELQFERSSKDEFEDRYKALGLEVDRYKQQNTSLLTQIQRLLKQGSEKDDYCVEKEKELRTLVAEFHRQVSLLRTAQEENSRVNRQGPDEQYQGLLNDKNRLAIEFTKLQTAYEELLSRQRQFYDMEQKMKSAKLQAERANQQVNMLRSKIVVLEAREFLEEAGDDGVDQKQFEERLGLLMNQNDPLNAIKNQDDTTHFRILKASIVDLQEKIYKINADKKQISRKYKSMKVRFVKNVEELTHLQQQNKLMRGKLQGYERLTEKLQFELEKALSSHEEEMTRMTLTSNNIITRKVEEYKATITLLTSQLEVEQDKTQRIDRNYKQEVETLRLELDTLKIRYRDETEKNSKDGELNQLYKRKNIELTSRINVLEEQLHANSENLSKFQSLFREEKGKNEGLLAQKQQLVAQVRQLSEQIDKKSSSVNTSYKIQTDQNEFEIRKLVADNQKLRDELEHATRQVNSLSRQLDEIRKGDHIEVQEIKRQSQKNEELEGKMAELRRRIRELEDENESLRIKNRKFEEVYNEISRFREESISKNDKINDLSRDKLMLESEVKNLQHILNEEKKQNQQYKRQLSALKMKSLESVHESKKEYELKILQKKKIIETLNQDIAGLTAELREQKSRYLRINNQMATVKSERTRLQEILDANRKKQLQNQNQVGSVRIQLSNAQMEVERLGADIRTYQATVNTLNSEIEVFQQKIFTLNQEISSLKMKVESAEDQKSDLIRDLNALKYNFSTVESYSNQAKANLNLSWNEQNFHSSLGDILTKIRRICKNYDISIEYSSERSSAVPSYTAGVSFNQPISPIPKADRKSEGNNYMDLFKNYAENDPPIRIGGALGQNYTDGHDASIGGGSNVVGATRVDYNYSESLIGGNSWNRGNIEMGSGNRNSFEFNISGLSRVDEEH